MQSNSVDETFFFFALRSVRQNTAVTSPTRDHRLLCSRQTPRLAKVRPVNSSTSVTATQTPVNYFHAEVFHTFEARLLKQVESQDLRVKLKRKITGTTCQQFGRRFSFHIPGLCREPPSFYFQFVLFSSQLKNDTAKTQRNRRPRLECWDGEAESVVHNIPSGRQHHCHGNQAFISGTTGIECGVSHSENMKR